MRLLPDRPSDVPFPAARAATLHAELTRISNKCLLGATRPRRPPQSERHVLPLPKQELKGHFTMLPMDEVHFGSGSLDNLSAELDKQGVSRVDIAGMSEADAATAAADEVATLVREDMGLPWRLRDVGVGHDDFAGIAKDALEDIIVASNPRQVTSTDEVIDLLHRAW